MGDILLSIIVLVVTFLFTFYLTKRWIPAAKYFGLVGRDLNKYEHPEVAEGGGFAVVLGLSGGLFFYLFLKALFGSANHLAEIYAVISTVSLAGFIGFSDDILGWKKGIKQRIKVLMSSIIILPIVTLTLLHPEYNSFAEWGIPLWFYSLVIVPVGMLGATNAVNMLGGYNGLEAGISIIILITISIETFLLGDYWISYLAALGAATLFGFIIFNWYPAKIFPGDSLTYSVGAFIGALVILGNIEIFGALMFPLFYLDFILFLKARKIDHLEGNTNPKAIELIKDHQMDRRLAHPQASGIPDKNNHLEPRYTKIYDSTHLAILIQKKLRGYATERGVVVTLYVIQIVISAVVLLVFQIWG